GPVLDPQTVHQSKFSMGTVLGLIAVHGRAGLTVSAAPWRDPAVAAFRERVVMRRDAEVDAAYPARWIGKVEVKTRDGQTLQARIDEPKGDPGNTLGRAEIEAKAMRLAAHRDGASAAERRRASGRIRALRDAAGGGTGRARAGLAGRAGERGKTDDGVMIEQLDHLVLTTAHEDACVRFYVEVLGMTLQTFAGGRKAFRFGEQKINLHVKGREFEPKAHTPV